MEVLPSLPLRRFPRQAPSYSGAGSVDASGGEVGGGAGTETRWGPSKPQARPWRVSTARQGARLSSERGPPCQLSWHGQRAVSPATSTPVSPVPVSTLSHRQNGCLHPSRAMFLQHSGGGRCCQGPVSRSRPLLNTSPPLRLEAGSPGRSRGRTAAPQTAQCRPWAAAARPHSACPAPPLL